MQPLLARLTGLDKQWRAAAAPTQIVSMEATALTHAEAVARLLEFLGQPAWPLKVQSVDPAAVYSTHTQFYQVPAGETVQLLDRISR